MLLPFLKTYFEDICKAEVEQTTYEGYMYIINNHIVPFFQIKGLKLQGIKQLLLQEYFTKKFKDGLKSATLKRHRAVLKRVFEHAKDMKIIESNPIVGVKLPKEKRKEIDCYTLEELKTLLEVVKGTVIETAVFLTIHFGFRRGEALGLRWSDIDFRKKTLHVRNTRTKVGKNKEKGPKTESSKRELPLNDNVIEHLVELMKKQSVDKVTFGNTYMENDYVVKYANGRPISTSTFNRKVTEIMEKSGLRHVRLHDLRHSTATAMMKFANIKEVQAWLGHSRAQTTQDIYLHVKMEQKCETGDMIGQMLAI